MALADFVAKGHDNGRATDADCGAGETIDEGVADLLKRSGRIAGQLRPWQDGHIVYVAIAANTGSVPKGP